MTLRSDQQGDNLEIWPNLYPNLLTQNRVFCRGWYSGMTPSGLFGSGTYFTAGTDPIFVFAVVDVDSRSSGSAVVIRYPPTYLFYLLLYASVPEPAQNKIARPGSVPIPDPSRIFLPGPTSSFCQSLTKFMFLCRN